MPKERESRRPEPEGQTEDEPERREKRGEKPDEAGPEKPRRKLPAGPHSDPKLTNPDATPGAGTLPPADEDEDPNMGSTG